MNNLIQHNTPLHDKNWFVTGGPARFFARPKNPKEFQEAVAFAQEKQQPIFLLGSGANILISDDGFDGVVIQPQLDAISVVSESGDMVYVQAGAGTNLHSLIEWCLDHNIIGLEEFSGIPGTVGGAVFINLHYFEFLLEQFLVEAQVIHKQTGEILTVPQAWFNFGYNNSALHTRDYFLLNATFRLKNVDDLQTAFARGRRKEIIRHRNTRYPLQNTCGSFFRNFHDDEVTLTSNGKKMIYVAYYLDKIGVKGHLASGDAIVSYRHANMIVNQGKATTADIITIARKMQQLVYENFDVLPQPECRLVGFRNYPLLTKETLEKIETPVRGELVEPFERQT